MQHLENGQKVMLLASCSYMLHPVIAVLRKWGIPFHNPYRKSNGFWNPLRHGRKGSSTNRILSLLGPHPWTHRDLKLWAVWLNTKGNLRTGAKELIEASDDSLPVTIERLNELFEIAALESLLAASSDSRQLLQWWSRRVAPTFHGRVQFPVAVALAGGQGALEESPRVIVGTIHSVKGRRGGCRLSLSGSQPSRRRGLPEARTQRDSVIRLLYVGLTRARHTLYICQRESSMAVLV